MVYHVFISYATKDRDLFQIIDTVNKIEALDDVDKCYYWEGDTEDDIIQYMEENLRKCEIFILASSPNSLASEPVGIEWRAALKANKQIIPIFFDDSHIPMLLSSKVGVKFDIFNMEENIQQTISEVVKRINLLNNSSVDQSISSENIKSINEAVKKLF